jgi:hypothetical protein
MSKSPETLSPLQNPFAWCYYNHKFTNEQYWLNIYNILFNCLSWSSGHMVSHLQINQKLKFMISISKVSWTIMISYWLTSPLLNMLSPSRRCGLRINDKDNSFFQKFIYTIRIGEFDILALAICLVNAYVGWIISGSHLDAKMGSFMVLTNRFCIVRHFRPQSNSSVIYTLKKWLPVMSILPGLPSQHLGYENSKVCYIPVYLKHVGRS